MRRILLFALLPFFIGACSKKANDTTIEKKHFEPNWESLSQYECPEWFRNAKFGIYTHWGVYSASKAEGNSDWYGRNMYNDWHPNYQFHLNTYGNHKDFGYKDLIPQLTGDKFNADEWAELFQQAGAQFAGPAGEHADGFSMWDSKVNPWNSKKMGPKIDVVAEMKKAVKKRGMKYVVSMHHSWLWGWYPTWDENTDCANPKYAGLYGPKIPESSRLMKVGDEKGSYPMPSPEFERIWLEKVKEVVDGYSPDLLWFDNRVKILSEGVRKEMVAYVHNHSAENNIERVFTFKRPDFPLGVGTVDLERERMPDIYPDPWLTDTSISKASWSWTSDLKCYPTNRLIDDLVDIVSKNGCLLLNVAPHPDGSIPQEQKDRLLEMGAWLKLNGEAIYDSRPWLIFGEGPTKTKSGHLADTKFVGFGEEDIRFTTKGDQLYAIALGWPESGELPIKSLGLMSYNSKVKEVELIGHQGKLKWERTEGALKLQLPKEKPGDFAYVFKISFTDNKEI
ncbi:alpha-L-fucosidase [Flammeovirga pacifica]|uniref:alpha-L-fucosidase n=1 Tax=Flammeovirga pacifica TaxID=915059 RepID=A0A1S1YV06_FLAPC|nr:alpha-L-fucosidase [Flammeovirga pacifica]OHX64703.1 alpha-L-fucosidase [Flammeovirga pacifica]